MTHNESQAHGAGVFAPAPRVLVLDDDADQCRAIGATLTSAGCAVACVFDSREAAAQLAAFRPDAFVTDVRMPDADGLTMLEVALRHDPLLGVVLLTGFANVAEAVRAMQHGAVSYLAKPVEPGELLKVVRLAVERRRLRREGGAHARQLVGTSGVMQTMREQIQLVAPQRTTVLLRGETGTGKERVAEALHAASDRAGGPFVRVHCSALPETLLESELFGHEKGAFTGAHVRREGRFKLADGGTLFLDEIGELSPATQVKLLRVLQERRFERVGGNETLTVDVRIIAATHRDLGAMVSAGAFRADLYYRLNVIALEVPPLRARKGDIAALVEYILGRLAGEIRGGQPTVTPEAMRLLLRYDWPGNVRELENVLERAMILGRGAAITPSELPVHLLPRAASATGPLLPGATFAEVERYAILTTYEACAQNVVRTAAVLGISPRAVHYRLREYRGQPGRRQTRLGSGAPPPRLSEPPCVDERPPTAVGDTLHRYL